MTTAVKSPFSPLVLIADDKNLSLSKVNLEKSLRDSGFITTYETSAQQAMRYLKNSVPNIIIIAEELDGMTANELCLYARTIERLKFSVIFIITSTKSYINKVSLEEGGPQEYIEYVEAGSMIYKIKEYYKAYRSPESARILRHHDIELNLNTYRVTRNNREIKLGPTEFKILQCFLEYPKNVLSRDFIMSYVWGKTNPIESRTIDVHINRLRTALKNNPDELPIIETIRSLGYCLRRISEEEN
ncbi:winged helix-turn-helix domain-containing protein [Rickettsiales endosymbiont of Stachyamoeba lipophora]|uniref:winged helix-turn-helix domain-containing protein n=1 Tax=Rickettsiales endosymbiont of Stachyamoeba lipophora TaxID=2486578 RepID=UPI000F64BA50|nr:response regulator transcription factor [Rickettsiales endosymbiont of Stachyamoeba lipophora]AZL15118.1 DNA-binding response regulator [Rickettsiales endosymbiont of Stachyamoeba lipophora]